MKHYTLRLFPLCTLFVILLIGSCSTPKEGIESLVKTPDEKTERGTYIISAPVVKQNFVNKAGRVTEHKEYYIRRSVQDYFIKFCESNINSEELEKLFNNSSDNEDAVFGGVSLTMEVEFRDGEWDICEGDPEMQSRIGQYVIIHRILEK